MEPRPFAAVFAYEVDAAAVDAFDLLYTGRGLSAKRVAELLIAVAERSLLP